MNPTPFIGEVEGDVFLISYSGASIYKKMSLGAINGPARFVFTKMTQKAINRPPNVVLWALGYVIGP